MTPKKSGRLEYIDWMRGLACVLMFQTHCYDSWLSPEARRTSFFALSQLGGTLPAPLFVFLAGVSSAFVADRLRSKGLSANKIAATMIRRGALIFGRACFSACRNLLWDGPTRLGPICCAPTC